MWKIATFLAIDGSKMCLITIFIRILREILTCLLIFQVLADALPSNVNEPKIINGTAASINETMHQVSVRRKETDSYFFGAGHICGGSLISPAVVLSAAHCFRNEKGVLTDANRIIVVMGTLNRYHKTNETLIVDVSHILLANTNFSWSNFEGDISMLFLEKAVPYNHTNVHPIVINRESMASDTICQATGWGRTEEGDLSDVLMTVDVPIIDFTICSTQTNFPNGTMREGMICAGYMEQGERDACFGDSGGPLVCNGALTGIISTGFNCALPKLPGIYTNVSHYAKWIDDELRKAMGNARKNLKPPGIVVAISIVLFSVKFLI